MWAIAGVLLGLVVFASLVGFHTGPHTQVVAGALGLLAAVALLIMAVEGSSTDLLWVLLAGDLTISAGVGLLAWRGMSGPGHGRLPARPGLLVHGGADGVAVSDLDPEGLVRVHGETWSAVAVNGPVRSGSPVQVVGRGGVRLEVWGEESLAGFGDADGWGLSEEGP